jgi:hypothetical protein
MWQATYSYLKSFLSLHDNDETKGLRGWRFLNSLPAVSGVECNPLSIGSASKSKESREMFGEVSM